MWDNREISDSLSVIMEYSKYISTFLTHSKAFDSNPKLGWGSIRSSRNYGIGRSWGRGGGCICGNVMSCFGPSPNPSFGTWA